MDHPTRKDAAAPLTALADATLDRRVFLTQGIKVAGAALAGGAVAPAFAAEPIGKAFPAWATTMGKPLSSKNSAVQADKRAVRAKACQSIYLVLGSVKP